MASLYKPIVFDDLKRSVYIAPLTHNRATVHDAGGRTFHQLRHVRRSSHRSLLPGNASPVAPSEIRTSAQGVDETRLAACSNSPALSPTKIEDTIDNFHGDSANVKAAWFDGGVEFHADNGRLIDKNVRSESNIRTATYRGSDAKRMRTLSDVMELTPQP